MGISQVPYNKPLHKFNGGNGATLCHSCRKIISESYVDKIFCRTCEKYKAVPMKVQNGELERVGAANDINCWSVIDLENSEKVLFDFYNPDAEDNAKSVAYNLNVGENKT